MSYENHNKLQINEVRRSVETEVVEHLQKQEYTLKTVNSYGENLLHISAANGCLDIIKEILKKWNSHDIIDRKSKYGWTPLMLAIRNRNTESVKFLLEKNVNVNESNYFGMSVLGLAAAVDREMFETVYQACPSALFNCMNDDITPLCIAAMKNDKDLFFRLLELGFEVSKSNEYTQIMMKRSVIPEIRNLAEERLEIEEYWNDISDNIPTEDSIETKCNINNNNYALPYIPGKQKFAPDLSKCDDIQCNNNPVKVSKKYLKPCALRLAPEQLEHYPESLISPNLSYNVSDMIPQSPNIYFMQAKHDNKESKRMKMQDKDDTKTYSENNDFFKSPPERLQSVCLPELNIQTEQDPLNTTIGYIPEFSPLRSPNVPPDINDENVFGENTPTPPRYKTPPRGMVLNSEEAKMFVLLKQYGLGEHIPIFLEQEVDINLFVTLTDNDLIEIGIQKESDRKTILDVVMNCRKSML